MGAQPVYMSTPAEMIRSGRRKRQWSQGDLAGELGVSQSLVSIWERGEAAPNPEQERKITALLRVRDQQSEPPNALVQRTSDIGQWLKTERMANGLIQTELAEKLGVSQPTVSLWELGKQTPDQNQLAALKKILGDDTAGASAQGSSDEAPSIFGVWLAKTRQAKHLTVNELALRAGVSVATLYNIETGRAASPHRKTIARLEAALNEQFPKESERELEKANEIPGLGEFSDFDPHDSGNLPEVAGVYVFYDISQRPIYVGQASNIKLRLRDHNEKFWFRRPIVDAGAYVPVTDKTLRDQLETILIKFLKQNAVINKNKVDRD